MQKDKEKFIGEIQRRWMENKRSGG